ncbi:hypothetical protein [Reyranella sp.]|uniref:hypothetical protein n=1 Tax=Reyranella sp. TaxID=1929291 RepID=UPI003BA99A92
MQPTRIVIPLTPDEEDTLRLVAHGRSPVDHLRGRDLDQLEQLGLLEITQDGAGLTPFGEVRVAQISEMRAAAMLRAARHRGARALAA